MLPAGVVRAVDHADRRILMDRSKEEIKNAPPFDPDLVSSADYHDHLVHYYAGWYGAAVTTVVEPMARRGRETS